MPQECSSEAALLFANATTITAKQMTVMCQPINEAHLGPMYPHFVDVLYFG